MKTRSGFVSNSSSSSFVFLGIKIDDLTLPPDMDAYKLSDKSGLPARYLTGVGYVIGFQLGNWDNRDTGITSFTMDNLQKMSNGLVEILRKSGVTTADIKMVNFLFGESES